ncbi:hypothetical protein MCOR15_002840 [Pyricularia oryzae]|nr:hypothetical protein MCOR15_002840 [Pyricularia oryzae]
MTSGRTPNGMTVQLTPSRAVGRAVQRPKTAQDLNKWSWANQAGPYQYYIHGSGSVDKYISLSPGYKNPNETASARGARFALDGAVFWIGQNMRRTELISQTTAGIHFTEMTYGWISGEQGTSNKNLQWMVGQRSLWKTEWKPDVWHNVAYEIMSWRVAKSIIRSIG